MSHFWRIGRMGRKGTGPGWRTIYSMTLRPIRAYREISKDLSELRAEQLVVETDARLELAQRASLFSRRSQKVVDETMSLSAVLIRAGEVDEAHRLLAEVDREVAEGKVALLESVNEVKTRQVVTRKKMTRLRMARLMLTAVLGASMMMFSAFGVALAKFLAPAPAQGAQAETIERFDSSHPGPVAETGVRHIRFAGMKIPLTSIQLAEYERLTAAGADDTEISEFLKKVLPKDLADKILTIAAPVTDQASEVLGAVKKSVRSTTANTSGSQSSGSEKKTENRSPSGDDDGDEDDPRNGGHDDEDCDPGSDDEQGDSSMTVHGGCIPIVNEESPV